MPSLAFLEKDKSTHGDLILRAYKSFVSDEYENVIYVIMGDNKKVSVNGSLFRVFSPLISSILSDNNPKEVPEIILPDFSEEEFTWLIEILTQGSTRLKNIGSLDVLDIKCLAQCLGIVMNNLEFTQDETRTSSLRIRIMSEQFVDAEVPNDLVKNEKDNHDDDDVYEKDVTVVEQPSASNVIEILSDNDEDQSDEPLEEKSVVNQEPKDECDDRSICNLTSRANNNDKCSIFTCDECPREFPTDDGFYHHKIMSYNIGSLCDIGCLLCKKSTKFISLKKLQIHIKTKHGSGPFSCDVCPIPRFRRKKFQSAKDFALHIVYMHANAIKQVRSEYFVKINDSKRLLTIYSFRFLGLGSRR